MLIVLHVLDSAEGRRCGSSSGGQVRVSGNYVGDGKLQLHRRRPWSSLWNQQEAVEDSACNHVGSVEPDPSVAGILQAVVGAGNGDGDEQADSAKCTVNQKFRV